MKVNTWRNIPSVTLICSAQESFHSRQLRHKQSLFQAGLCGKGRFLENSSSAARCSVEIGRVSQRDGNKRPSILQLSPLLINNSSVRQAQATSTAEHSPQTNDTFSVFPSGGESGLITTSEYRNTKTCGSVRGSRPSDIRRNVKRSLTGDFLTCASPRSRLQQWRRPQRRVADTRQTPRLLFWNTTRPSVNCFNFRAILTSTATPSQRRSTHFQGHTTNKRLTTSEDFFPQNNLKNSHSNIMVLIFILQNDNACYCNILWIGSTALLIYCKLASAFEQRTLKTLFLCSTDVLCVSLRQQNINLPWNKELFKFEPLTNTLLRKILTVSEEVAVRLRCV